MTGLWHEADLAHEAINVGFVPLTDTLAIVWDVHPNPTLPFNVSAIVEIGTRSG